MADQLAAALASADEADLQWDGGALDAIGAAGRRDPRHDAERAEGCVRALLTGWVRLVADVDVDVDVQVGTLAPLVRPDVLDDLVTGGYVGGRVRVQGLIVRQVRLRGVIGAPDRVRVLVLSAGRRWVEDRVTGEVLAGERDSDSALGDLEWWTVSQDWQLCPDGPVETPWQLVSAVTGSLAEVFGYRFVSRIETPDEQSLRLASPPRPGAATVREERSGGGSPSARFLVSADFHDHSVRYGGSASVLLVADRPPSRPVCVEALMPAMLAEFERANGPGGYQPQLSRLESRELLPDGPA